MIKQILELLIITTIFSSCCIKDSVEVARYELSMNEIKLVPYEKGKKIRFKHSNGFEFEFSVIDRVTEWKEHHDFCEWNCCGRDYYSYQISTTKLHSNYPRFDITFILGTDSYYSDYLPKNLGIQINSQYFLSFRYDSLANIVCDTPILCFDSLSINNKFYYHVYKSKADYNMFTKDTTILAPNEILYNKEKGLLQIKISNNEAYSIYE